MVLKPLDIFEYDNRKFYLVTPYAKGGTLADSSRSFTSEGDIFNFVERITNILYYLHFDVLKGYRAKEPGEEQK